MQGKFLSLIFLKTKNTTFYQVKDIHAIIFLILLGISTEGIHMTMRGLAFG